MMPPRRTLQTEELQEPSPPRLAEITTTHSCSSLPSMITTSSTTTTTESSQNLPSSSSLHSKPSNNKSKSSVARQKRNSWMRSSVVRRAATVVDEEVAALCEKSPFLNSVSQENTTTIARFHRSEVQLGPLLGRGGFAEVYTVAKLDIANDDSDNDNDMDAVRRRRECHQRLATAKSPPYAIKLLRKKLLSNTREFQHAAIDLAVESQYLAALSHRNIIQIRGLTRGGTSAFRTGKHDDFFIIMDQLQETLDCRIRRWQQRHEREPSCPPEHYFPRTLQYAYQVADALAYLHDKSIVYRDLKPTNLGFRREERDVICLFDFGLCRELPKPKGQCHHDENLQDEETFHMSGVGTQRYMAPEIINTRRYNLKADTYSLAMVILEMMSWKKPFCDYSPEEHTKHVAGMGERPILVATCLEEENTAKAQQQQQQQQQSDNNNGSAAAPKPKQTKPILVKHWPCGMVQLLQESWTQDVGDRLTMQAVLERMGKILADFNNSRGSSSDDDTPIIADSFVASEKTEAINAAERETEVVLEFPSHFSPQLLLSSSRQQQQHQSSKPAKQQQPKPTRDDLWFGQSDASSTYQEQLTMTSSVSTTMHDSNSSS